VLELLAENPAHQARSREARRKWGSKGSTASPQAGLKQLKPMAPSRGGEKRPTKRGEWPEVGVNRKSRRGSGRRNCGGARCGFK